MADHNNLVRKKEGESSLITWMKNRVDRNENVNLSTLGPTGSGKTYTDIQLAMELDDDFDPTRQIVFKFTDLMKLIKDPWFLEKKYKPVIYEEFQISQNARAWYDKVNKLLNYLLSTYRHRNIILMINCPYMDFIDSQTRRLFHLQIEMRGKNLKLNLARVRPKIIQYNGDEKKFYFHSLYVIDEEGYYEKTPYYLINKPPQDVCEIYEKMKTSFTDELNADIEQQLENMIEKPATDDDGEYNVDNLNPDSMQPMIYEVAKSGYVILKDVREEMERRMSKVISESQFYRNVLGMRKKGCDIRKFRKK